MNNKKIGGLILSFISVLTFCLFLALSCQSAEKNITAKDLNCQKLTQENSLSCCLQLMSSNSGNDSKDSFCSSLERELSEKFRETRKKELFTFCQKQKNFQNCWDKLNTK